MMILQERDNTIDFKIPIHFLYEEDRKKFIKGLVKIFEEVIEVPTTEPDREYNDKERERLGGGRWNATDILYLINNSHEDNDFLAQKLKRSSTSIKLARNRIYDINAWVNKNYKNKTPITLELIKQYLEDKK